MRRWVLEPSVDRSCLLAFRSGRVNETDALALVILTWNAHRAGETRTKLQLPRSGLTPENFPEPR